MQSNNAYKEDNKNIDMKKGNLLAVVIISLFLINISLILGLEEPHNLTASISNPKMVLYKNITEDFLKFQNSVIINNENNFDVQISIEPNEDWKDNVVIEEDNFVLQAGDRKEVFYDVTIDKKKLYAGDIIVTFDDGINRLSVTQRLVVHADKKIGSWIYIIGGILAVLIVLAIVGKGIKK